MKDAALHEMSGCVQDMQRLIDALDLRHDKREGVRSAAESLHDRLSRVSLHLLDERLRRAGR